MVAIHIQGAEVDEVFTVGGEGADVLLEDAFAQIPDAPVDDLVARLCAVADPSIRLVMMYHAALAHIDRNDLWARERVTFTVGGEPCGWSAEVA